MQLFAYLTSAKVQQEEKRLRHRNCLQELFQSRKLVCEPELCMYVLAIDQQAVIKIHSAYNDTQFNIRQQIPARKSRAPARSICGRRSATSRCIDASSLAACQQRRLPSSLRRINIASDGLVQLTPSWLFTPISSPCPQFNLNSERRAPQCWYTSSLSRVRLAQKETYGMWSICCLIIMQFNSWDPSSAAPCHSRAHTGMSHSHSSPILTDITRSIRVCWGPGTLECSLFWSRVVVICSRKFVEYIYHCQNIISVWFSQHMAKREKRKLVAELIWPCKHFQPGVFEKCFQSELACLIKRLHPAHQAESRSLTLMDISY